MIWECGHQVATREYEDSQESGQESMEQDRLDSEEPESDGEFAAVPGKPRAEAGHDECRQERERGLVATSQDDSNRREGKEHRQPQPEQDSEPLGEDPELRLDVEPEQLQEQRSDDPGDEEMRATVHGWRVWRR